MFMNLDKMLVCPLSTFPSIENSTSSMIYNSYGFYAGTYLLNGYQGMFKLGDAVEISGKSFTVMMGDKFRANASSQMQLSHDGPNFQMLNRNDGWITNGGWKSYSVVNYERNFVYQDGHVDTIRGISASSGTVSSSRLMQISNWADGKGSSSSFQDYVPWD